MFLNVVMLAGIGGAAVPLVLHLLARARYRTVDWGAMMFLEGADVRHARGARLRQWVLLGMRMALVGLVAVALARPIVRRQWGGTGGGVTAVIVLDRSLSLAAEEAGRSRFDKAREAALQILSTLRQGDQVSLVLLGETVEVRYPEATANVQAAAREIAELQVSHGAADLNEGLRRAREVLDRAGKLDRELYVVCDRQAANWRHIDGADAIKRWAHDARTPTRLYVVPVGGDDADNVAVSSVRPVDPTPIRGQATEVLVTVRSFASAPRAGMELRLRTTAPPEGGRRSGEIIRDTGQPQVIRVPARGETSVRVSGVVFREAGPHVLSAEIKAPGLEADNRLDVAVDVIDPIETLIVSGDEKDSEHTPEARRESFFLRLALTPYQSSGRRTGAGMGDPARVTVRGPESLSEDLGKYQVIVLANVPQVTPDQARALEQRTYEGAGLIISPGALSRVENYNALLWRDGQGLLPAKLNAPVPGDGSYATSLLGVDVTHPVFRFRRGTDPLPNAVIGRYFPAEPLQAGARAPAEYASGQKFLVEGQRGRGRVLLVTTPLDADWNTLPLSPFYLPFVQSMVRYAYAPPTAMGVRNLRMGELYATTLGEPSEDALLNDKPARDFLTAGGTQFRYEQTQKPGVYHLAIRARPGQGPWRHSYFVVAPPEEESDLTPLDGARWRSLEQSIGFTRIESGGDRPLAPLVSAERGGRELWLTVLCVALAVALGEVALARFWTEGVA
jgi:hypothetical protein